MLPHHSTAIAANHAAYKQIAGSRSGERCWNSEVGCGPQIRALKFLGGGLLLCFLISIVFNKLAR